MASEAVTRRSTERDLLMARAAALHIGGATVKQIADACGISVSTLKNWRRTPVYKGLMEGFVQHTYAAIEEMLSLGEKKATSVLIEALDAKYENERPDWNTRLQAARRLLDMQGQRGRPTEKQEIQQTTHEIKGNLTEALTEAMRDPGVQRWLVESGNLPKPMLSPVPPQPDVEDADYEIEGGTEE